MSKDLPPCHEENQPCDGQHECVSLSRLTYEQQSVDMSDLCKYD